MKTKFHIVKNLSKDQIASLKKQLPDIAAPSMLKNLFWFPIDESDLTQTQKTHLASCGPYVMALELLSDALTIEFLARSMQKISCDCVSEASKNTQKKVLSFIDGLIPNSERQA